MGGQLPELEDGADFERLLELFPSTLVVGVFEFLWLGATDLDTPRTFVWPSGNIVTADMWAGGEPNNVNERYTAAGTFGTRRMCDVSEIFGWTTHLACAIKQ